MDLPREILQLQQIPQPQIIVFNNITKIISRSYIERTVVNPPDDFLYLHLFALVVVLILGFVLGISAMFLYLRWDKWVSKSQNTVNLKRNDPQQSIAESDSCGNLAKSECPSLDSRSTSAKSSPSLGSETDERGTMAPIFLENGQYSTGTGPSQRKGSISELSEGSEMKFACIQGNFSRRDSPGINDTSVSAPVDNQQLLQLKPKQEYSQSSGPAEIPQPEVTEKSDRDIASIKEESEICHKNEKSEKTVDIAKLHTSKPEELKQPIPHAHNRNPKECPNLVCLENREELSVFENGRQLIAERKPSTDFKDLKSVTPTQKEDDVVLNPQRQTSPAKELNEDRLNGCDAIRLLRTPSPMCSSKPLPANQGFSHLTGFFDTVFGDKSLIGKGGFGEVFKAIHKLEQKLYAVKKVKLLVKEGEDIRQNKLFREVFAMISLHHPHIVRHHTTWTEEPPVTMKPEHILKKPCDNRRLACKRQKSQESLSMAEEHTKISDLGFQWDVSNQEESQTSKHQAHQTENSSDTESFSRSHSMIKTVSQVQTSVLEEDLKSHNEESISILSKSVLRKLRDHQLVYLFLQMEYCSGDSLMNYLDGQRNPKNSSDIFKIFKQILEGVSAIHETGIIHRDLKPSNIFFEKGFVKIGDFGLSWLGDQQEEDPEAASDLTSKEEIKAGKANGYTSNIGTPFYISPEQEKSTIYDNKTDIYSLGIILFELISYFKTRHERGENIKALRNEAKIDVQLAQRFPELSKLVLNMTDKNPEKRPSAKEALAMLEKIGGNH